MAGKWECGLIELWGLEQIGPNFAAWPLQIAVTALRWRNWAALSKTEQPHTDCIQGGEGYLRSDQKRHDRCL